MASLQKGKQAAAASGSSKQSSSSSEAAEKSSKSTPEQSSKDDSAASTDNLAALSEYIQNAQMANALSQVRAFRAKIFRQVYLIQVKLFKTICASSFRPVCKTFQLLELT